MDRIIIQLPPFSRYLDDSISKRRLAIEDYERFEWELVHNPQMGDVIPGCFGLRKSRLKSINKGKSGGFRVDYLDIPEVNKIYLLVLYPKNIKEDLSSEEKKVIISLVKKLKEGAKNG